MIKYNHGFVLFILWNDLIALNIFSGISRYLFHYYYFLSFFLVKNFYFNIYDNYFKPKKRRRWAWEKRKFKKILHWQNLVLYCIYILCVTVVGVLWNEFWILLNLNILFIKPLTRPHPKYCLIFAFTNL